MAPPESVASTIAVDETSNEKAPEDDDASSSPTEQKEEEEDPLHLLQWLFQTIELDTPPEYCQQSLQVHKAALQCIIDDPSNAIQASMIGIDVITLPDDNDESSPFDFNAVHHLPLTRFFEQHPIVLQAVYCGSRPKCFVRVKTDLTVMDGVTVLHAGLNLLEYLETGSISPFPFRQTNTLPPADVQFANFSKQLDRVESAKQAALADGTAHADVWHRTPFVYQNMEDKFDARHGLRFTRVDVSYKEAMGRLEQARQSMGIDFYAVTVNFSPHANLALCPTLEDVLDKDRRNSHMTFPPAGTGPPPLMNEFTVQVLFNTVVVNNYGKHQLKLRNGKVTGYLWDWSGFCKTFAPLLHVVTIQDELFLSMSGSPPDVVELKQFFPDAEVGVSESFRGLPFHVPIKN